MALFNHALDIVNPDNWTSLDLRVLLLRSTGSAPTASVTTVADMFTAGAVELSDTAYVRKTLSGLSVLTTGPDRAGDADSPTWTALGGAQTCSGVVLFQHITNDAGSKPLAWWTFSQATTGGDFSAAWAAGGLINWNA